MHHARRLRRADQHLGIGADRHALGLDADRNLAQSQPFVHVDDRHHRVVFIGDVEPLSRRIERELLGVRPRRQLPDVVGVFVSKIWIVSSSPSATKTNFRPGKPRCRAGAVRSGSSRRSPSCRCRRRRSNCPFRSKQRRERQKRDRARQETRTGRDPLTVIQRKSNIGVFSNVQLWFDRVRRATWSIDAETHQQTNRSRSSFAGRHPRCLLRTINGVA